MPSRGLPLQLAAPQGNASSVCFSPSAPITRKDLFAGRTKQLMQLIDAVTEPGQHAVIYGERGVGKTSMAAVCVEIFAPHAVKVNC